MRERTVSHLRSHLSVFEPGYPIQKGYIAQLLLYCPVPAVLSEIQSIVDKAEPDKCVHEGTLSSNLYEFNKVFNEKKQELTKEWPSLIRLFLEKFPITFKSRPDLFASSPLPASISSPPSHDILPSVGSDLLTQPDTSEFPIAFRSFPIQFASCQAGHASCTNLSASNLTEQSSASILETLIHPDSPEDSLLLQSMETIASVNYLLIHNLVPHNHQKDNQAVPAVSLSNLQIQDQRIKSFTVSFQ